MRIINMAAKREGIHVTAICRRNKYGNNTISIVFVNASFVDTGNLHLIKDCCFEKQSHNILSKVDRP